MEESKFLNFTLSHHSTKTSTYHVHSKKGFEFVGIIKWYSGWRRYTFYPKGGTLYDENCLKEIADFINKLMDDRKKK